MHHCLGYKLYKAPAKVPGVSSNIEEWKLHLYRHLRVIQNLQQESRQYGIGWEGSVLEPPQRRGPAARGFVEMPRVPPKR